MELVAPFEGQLIEIKVKAGDAVVAGDTVAVLNAMKLDTDIKTEVLSRLWEDSMKGTV